MNDILFITVSDFSQRVDNGGVFVSKKNLYLLHSLSGHDVTALAISNNPKNDNKLKIEFLSPPANKIFKFFLWFIGYPAPFHKGHEQHIIRYLKTGKYSTVFIDQSSLGTLVKNIKRRFPEIKIITHFHNFEYGLSLEKYRLNIANAFNLIRFLTFAHNEKLAALYSDVCIAINERDKIQIERKYTIHIDCIIPVLFDEYTPPDEIPDISCPLEVLFLGSWFWPNVKGIKWFIDNVLPLTDIKLTVAGRGMEKLHDYYTESEKLTILGTVQDLDEVYTKVDCVIAPISGGSGMKIKTGEALLHGKTVVGTHEAFEGYNITNGVEGYICETVDEYLESFKQIAENQKKKINHSSCVFIKNNLSLQSGIKTLSAILL